MEAVHVHDEDAHHRERAVVKGRLSVGRLVLRRERVAVEVGEGGLAAADFEVGLVGERVHARVGAEEAREVEQVAVGRRDRRSRSGGESRSRRPPRSRRSTSGNQRSGPAVA